MSDIDNSSKLNKLCNLLQLGEIICEPQAVSGGLLHKMHCVQTAKGKYAVKELNPKIMLRPEVKENFINSETVANIAANYIPALPSKVFNGSSIQELDKQFYLVFDWVDAVSLNTYEINKVHCEKIGEILANIHRIDFSTLPIKSPNSREGHFVDWKYYLQKGIESTSVWVGIMDEIVDSLYIWNTEANESLNILSSNMLISHRDMDPKNVLWKGNEPIIIDWESAGYVNPMYELLETALYWSENESGIIIKENFFAFIEGYKKKWGALQTNWKLVLQSIFSGKLAWLEYNLKRSLWMECTDEEEQRLGTAQVIGTIYKIKEYADLVFGLEKWLSNEL